MKETKKKNGKAGLIQIQSKITSGSDSNKLKVMVKRKWWMREKKGEKTEKRKIVKGRGIRKREEKERI